MTLEGNAHQMKIIVGGKELIFETGKIARQANGAVLVRLGETVVFSSACAASKPLDDASFLPLRVDYQEKFSSAGKTLGGFIKREGKFVEREVLVSRLIDRPLRPLFPKGYFQDTQLLNYVFSYDGTHSPEPLAICSASAALTLSDIPLTKPIAAVRVGKIDGQFLLNPTVDEMKRSCLDLVLAGTKEAILMIEGYAHFLPQSEIMEAIETGHASIREICQALLQWQSEVGKEKQRDHIDVLADKVVSHVSFVCENRIKEALNSSEKQSQYAALQEIEDDLLATHNHIEEEEISPRHLSSAFDQCKKQVMRKKLIESQQRLDQRGFSEIRTISIEPSLLPCTHGSVLFTRGETQTIAVCTLGGESMGQRFEDLDGDGVRRFYLQYTFPPFSVGEVGRVGPPSRREVGHGKLAERALSTLIPSEEEFPYSIRLESNIMESNGSSSMASVCGGCLALMEAGVPISRPVAGIAMGLLLEQDQAVILSDISGMEDALGDMDFKITGDAEGITAFQMDIKIEGITPEIMKRALTQANEGIVHILGKMKQVCLKSKPLSPLAPRIGTVQINREKIGKVIGPGGAQIRALTKETGAEISINDNGIVQIIANDENAFQQAEEKIRAIVAEPEVGKTYNGKVVSVVPFGLFIEILPGCEGLCHISELSNRRVENINEFAKVGEEMVVKVMEINDKGQVRLTKKGVLLPPPQ